MSSNTTLTISIENMMCEQGCARRVERMLGGMAGVRAATVDFPRRQANLHVEADRFDEPKALQTLADAGFPSAIVSRLPSSSVS